ncbi:DUF559 domain-containing protein [Mesorhizobium sp. BR1-1-9]|nr:MULTISPECIES: DUF559 domain-containing protein [unclassified Mesorhizobium]MBZ9871884.1 DUF559 domain-containing protein [Mesorhizobium sp. BR1-1-9]MBZ9944390.1 DUF559 domain-containing protein [Mesorhizobium sp. BR1-1-13]
MRARRRNWVVEADGARHTEVDALQSTKQGQCVWTRMVLRFGNDDVIRDIDNVCSIL